MNKKIFFLLVFGIIIFSLRLFNLNETLYDDESNFAYSVTVMDKFGFNENYYSPQPLNFIYKPFIALFSLETWVFRLIPWLFGIINTIFVYFFAKRNWNGKVAFFTAFLMLVAFYPTLASLQFDVEGSLVMFSVLLMFFSYLEYEKAVRKDIQFFWQVLAGLGLGIAVISKYNAIYVVLVLALYSLVKRKGKIKESFNDLFMVYLTGGVIFLGYILLAVMASPQHWLDFVGIIGSGRYYTSYLSLLGITLLLLWSTPLLFGFYLLSLGKWAKKNLLLVLWVTVPLLFYTFIVTYGSMDRYFMNIIPALAVLGGFYLAEVDLKKKQLAWCSVLFVFFTLIFFLMNTFPLKYVSRFPGAYLSELKNLNLNFLFAYTSASGPTFGISFAPLFFSFFLGFAGLMLYLIFNGFKKKSSWSKCFFIVFISVSLAFNVFLVSEYLFHPTGVEVSKVKWEMIDYVKSREINYPIYTNDQGIQWYFEPDFWRVEHNPQACLTSLTIGFGDNEVGEKSSLAWESIKRRGGTALLLRWPPLPEKSPAWEVVGLCSLKKQFYSTDVLLGEVYDCG